MSDELNVVGVLGVIAILGVIGTAIAMPPTSRAAEPQKDRINWQKNYLGATVTIGGRPGTVIRDHYGAQAIVGFPDGKELKVDWLVVVRQVDKACATVEKP